MESVLNPILRWSLQLLETSGQTKPEGKIPKSDDSRLFNSTSYEFYFRTDVSNSFSFRKIDHFCPSNLSDSSLIGELIL